MVAIETLPIYVHNIRSNGNFAADFEYEAGSAANLLVYDGFHMLSIFFDTDPQGHPRAIFGRNDVYDRVYQARRGRRCL